MCTMDEPDTGGEVREQISDVPATSKLNGDDLCDVLEAVHDAHSQWHGIGLQLRLPPPTLEGIEKEYSNSKDMLREMLKHWLKQVTPMPSWVTLIEALRSKTVNEQGLAEELEKKHILPPSRGILTHTVSNFTDQHKQFLGQLQATAEEVNSQLESYEEILQRQKSEKVDPSDEAPEAAQGSHKQRTQSDTTGLKTNPEMALHIQLKHLMGRIATLVEENVTDKSGLNPKAVPVTKEYEMESLRAHNSELEEELHSVKDKLAELEEKNTLLTAEKENLKKERQSLMDKMVEKDEEIAKKAKDVAEKSADYTSLHVEKEELEIKVQKLAEENELLKSHLQSLEEMLPPGTS